MKYFFIKKAYITFYNNLSKLKVNFNNLQTMSTKVDSDGDSDSDSDNKSFYFSAHKVSASVPVPVPVPIVALDANQYPTLAEAAATATATATTSKKKGKKNTWKKLDLDNIKVESTPKQTQRELHAAESLHRYQLQQAGGLPWQEYKQEWNKRAAKIMQERKEKDEAEKKSLMTRDPKLYEELYGPIPRQAQWAVPRDTYTYTKNESGVVEYIRTPNPAYSSSHK